MPRKDETEVERYHGHCADMLMDDYGIPKSVRIEVCEEIAKVWVQSTMIHSLIIWSVRGYQPHSATNGLKNFLQQHAGYPEPKNHKPEVGMSGRALYHQPERGHR